MKPSQLSTLLVAALRDHLASGRRPYIPEPGRLVWEFFVDLNGRRSLGGVGPNPITFTDIEAWQRVTGWEIAQHHIDAIRALDDAWLEHTYRKPSEDVKLLPHRSSHDLSPAMFDLAVS